MKKWCAHQWCGSLAVALAVTVSIGCGSSQKPAESFDSVKAKLLHPKPLKAGRYQLPTTHTPAPDFWITIPTGYQLKYVGRMPDDEFYVYSTSDPSMTDSSAITTGVLRIYVGTMPQTGLKGDALTYSRKSTICGQSLVWTGATERENGIPFYIREISSPTFFAALAPELKDAPLNLHLYAAGTDSVRVEELIHAAETINTKP